MTSGSGVDCPPRTAGGRLVGPLWHVLLPRLVGLSVVSAQRSSGIPSPECRKMSWRLSWGFPRRRSNFRCIGRGSQGSSPRWSDESVGGCW